MLVPLGDILEQRSTIVVQFLVLAAAIALAAASPTTATLIVSSFLLGMSATVAQQIVPFAATLADDRRRGAVVGTIVSGILVGILLAAPSPASSDRSSDGDPCFGSPCP